MSGVVHFAPTLHDGRAADAVFLGVSKRRLVEAVENVSNVTSGDKRTTETLLAKITSLQPEQQEAILLSIAGRRTCVKRRGAVVDESPLAKRARVTHQGNDASMRSPEDLMRSAFLEPVGEEVHKSILERFIDRTSNAALATAVCAICARIQFQSKTKYVKLLDIPHRDLLEPAVPHAAHYIRHGMLLYRESVSGEDAIACSECMQHLKGGRLPPVALANNLWVGDVPFELRNLNLCERILIARYFPAAYIVKLYPKGQTGFCDAELQKGVKGNVSTYPLNIHDVAKLADGSILPQLPSILAATVGITIVGPNNAPESRLPGFFVVRRRRVLEALLWLKANNRIYADIEICEERLAMLPEHGVPPELQTVTRYSDDMDLLNRESDGYVPVDDDDDSNGEGEENVTETEGQWVHPVSDGHFEEGVPADGDVEPGLYSMQVNGVVDTEGSEITDSELMASAWRNMQMQQDEMYNVRRGHRPVSEYPRNACDDGGVGPPEQPNHLLGAFPVLFPYGEGGFETERPRKVSYEAHGRWALMYADKRFRKDLQFAFQIFGVIQKRLICSSACLQMKRGTYRANESLIRNLTSNDLRSASEEERLRVPFTNPGVRALHKLVSAIRSRVRGTDQHRRSSRSKMWGAMAVLSPATLWITINPADIHDPIAQVMVGEDIDMDNFNATLGPNRHTRARNIAEDPFAAAQYFHFLINLILEEVMGIKVNSAGRINRQVGVFGRVKGYIGNVEMQGRGSLHIHMLAWLEDAPSPSEMKEALKSTAFRQRLSDFIAANMTADIEGMNDEEIRRLKKVGSVAYDRPPDPRKADYHLKVREMSRNVPRATQYHVCSERTCIVYKGGERRCKRRAPFPLASKAWVDESGAWGLRRLCRWLNGWNKMFSLVTRGNNDVQVITHGPDTKDIIWYITNYASKASDNSYNTSALLAKRLAFHHLQEKDEHDLVTTNKRLLQRCANCLSSQREFGAQEVMSYIMGWGDHYSSHTFVPIYWDNVVVALKKQFTSLDKCEINPAGTEKGLDGSSNDHTGVTGDHTQDETLVTLQVTEAGIGFRDQMGEYVFRGHPLEEHSYLDFFLDTYDAAMPSATDGQEREDRRGRPRSIRIPYLPHATREKRCRIIRSAGHETLPRFIGAWFPSADDKDDRELYCACMLALLKPWRELRDLKGGWSTFEEAFSLYKLNAEPRVLRIIDNINYYHESGRMARKNSAGDIVAAASRGDAMFDEAMTFEDGVLEGDQIGAIGAPFDVTEADIERARYNRLSASEQEYGRRAMDIAFAAGVFDANAGRLVRCTAAPLRRASVGEATQYLVWDKEIRKALRSQVACHSGSGANLPMTGMHRARMVSSVIMDDDTSQQRHSPLLDLNEEQRRALFMVEQHLRKHMAGSSRSPLRMLVLGPGGTGKTTIIDSITELFHSLHVSSALAKTGTTGVSAIMIEGQTVHSFGGIGINIPRAGDWLSRASKVTEEKRKRNIGPVEYLIVDEFSMMEKQLLACLSEVCQDVRVKMGKGTAESFGGMNVIMFGDFHQFPPVAKGKVALYTPNRTKSSARERKGRDIYLEFDNVVILKEQMRVRDPTWSSLLERLRDGDCTEADVECVSSLVLTNPACDIPDFSREPWSSSILVTPRHSVRERWNAASLRRLCLAKGQHLYISGAEDTIGRERRALSMTEKYVVAGESIVKTKLAERVELAVGMSAMVMKNIATEMDLANGTRGIVEDIVLDYRETAVVGDAGEIVLQFPPAMILFRPQKCTFEPMYGLPPGVIPVFPSETSFTVKLLDGGTKQIARRQYFLTPAYAFTDYKSQGQTIEHVVVDLGKPPVGEITPFAAYIALSRSRGRDTIRLLRPFSERLMTTHPCEFLRGEDKRLESLDAATKIAYPPRNNSDS